MAQLAQLLMKLRPLLAQAATKALAEWQPDEDGYDEMLGGGGCCDQIASEMSGVIATHVPDVEIADGGQDGDDHAWIITRLGDEVLGVDIPPHVYEEGGGMSWRKTADTIEPSDISIFETWWPDDDLYEGKGRMHKIFSLIESGQVTVEDFDELITETNIKSVKERVRRAASPLNPNRMHDGKGHSRLGKRNQAGRINNVSGGSMNDPRKTGRGRAALKRQELLHSEGKESKRKQALELLRKHVPCKADLYGVWWHGEDEKIRVSNGDWAEYDTSKLNDELVELLGKDKVEMDAEIAAPSDMTGWEYFGPCKKDGQNPPLAESQFPKASFRSKAIYDPVCPHCGEVMHEKHYVPDQDTMRVRVEKIHDLPKEDLGRLMNGELDMDLGPYLFRHRGECYDKGPFQIEWPSQAFAESKLQELRGLIND